MKATKSIPLFAFLLIVMSLAAVGLRAQTAEEAEPAGETRRARKYSMALGVFQLCRT